MDAKQAIGLLTAAHDSAVLESTEKPWVKITPNEAKGAINLIQHQAEQIERMRWIPVSERLPEEGIEVIVTGVQDSISFTEGGYAWFGDYFSNDYDDNIPLKDVTHWMPLPDRPEGL